MTDLFSLPALVFCVIQIHRLRVKTSGTTAETPRRWCLAAIAVCTAVTVLRMTLDDIRLVSAAHYLAAVMLLTPFVAVLGARQPGAGAWPWFVVLPLVIVLQWPSLSELSSGNAASPVIVPTPTVCGFLFVLTMGAGNYFGTLNTVPMLATVAGVLSILTGVTELFTSPPVWLFATGCCCLAVAAFMIPGHFFTVQSPGAGADSQHAALWSDFRDMYGIVWAKRVMERVNQFAGREGWPVRMTLDGFQHHPGCAHPSPSDQHIPVDVPDRAITVLCWVLRRFVGRDFLRQYLPERLVLSDIKDT